MSPTENKNPSTAEQIVGQIISVVRGPMTFNALAVILVYLLAVHFDKGATAFTWWCFGFIAAVTMGLNVFAAINPRFLAYGSYEYIRESEMAHERRMKGIE
jgi:Na+-transporting NADH:ubiquinone oxidoreductase subunit NqrB